MKSLSRTHIYMMLTLVMLLWAGNALVGRAVRDDIPPFTLALFRWAGATLILLPFAGRGIASEWPVVRAHWRKVLFLGLLGVGSFNALLYAGLQQTTATNALLIQAAIPAIVLMFDFALFQSRANLVQAVGVTLAAMGAVLIIFRADLAALLALSFGHGDVLILLGVIAWALYTTLLRKRPPLSALTFLTVTFAIGVLAMLPLAIREWPEHPVRWTPIALASIAYVAVLPSIVAYFLYNRAVSQIGAAQAGQVISLQPLFGAVLAALLLGETLHGYHAIGMALITLGIAVPALWRKPQP